MAKSLLIAGSLAASLGLPANAPIQVDRPGPTTIDWRIDNLNRIGGHAVTLVGAPKVVQTDRGPAVEFNGSSDGLLIDANPLAGLAQFTIEAVFRPAAAGPAEQRFLHFEEAVTENRALIELRMMAGGRWALDTFLRSPEPGLALIDRQRTHPAGEWYVATLTYDGRTMAHLVDGVRERSGDVPFRALDAGQTSIGMRQNRVSWFKGVIHSVRIRRGVSSQPAYNHAGLQGDPGVQGEEFSSLISLTSL